jgi:hypothetical protein
MNTDTIPCPPPSDMVSETVMVTPEMARTWLERNLVNRPLIPRNVDGIAWDIANGKWTLTHQGIAFNRDLLLVDGQHRLQAVIAAERAVPMRVSYNVDCDYVAPIDTGCMRRVHHVLGMTHRRVAVCNAMVLLETGSVGRSTASRVTDVHTKHERGISWALDAFPVQRRLNANVLAAHAFAYPVASDLVDDFAYKLSSGANIEEGSPVLTLRRHLERIEAFTSATRAQIALVTLRCLQAFCEREVLAKVYPTELGLAYFAKRRAEMGL